MTTRTRDTQVKAAKKVDVISEREFLEKFGTARFLEGCTIKRGQVRVPGYSSRTTIWKWHKVLMQTIDDYVLCPTTFRPLTGKRKPFNLHQVWCLLKVARWMRSHPDPDENKLLDYLEREKDNFTHKQYFGEYHHVKIKNDC
jgi:hypothetical protein